jgi:feruloyl esterase
MLGSLSLALLASAAAGTTPCESLKSLSTPQAVIESAEFVQAGPFVPPGAGRGAAPAAAAGRGAAPGAAAAPSLPRHCRVVLVLKPSSDSKIGAELWMPAENWNGKFMMMGNGGFAGSIQGYGDMQEALRLGYATAGSDAGHTAAEGPNGMFALGHPEKIVDFSHRAVHETTVTSKQLIKEFYARAAQYSYFKGCSTGGRQAVMAAQLPTLRRDYRRRPREPAHPHAHRGIARAINLARNPTSDLPSRRRWSTPP